MNGLRALAGRFRFGAIPIWIYILGGIGLLPVADDIFHRGPLFEILDSLLLAFIVGVIVAGAKSSLKALLRSFREITVAEAYIFAGTVQLIGLAVSIAGLWYWRFIGRPLDVSQSFTWLLGRWLLAMGFFAELVVVWTTQGTVEATAFRKTLLYATLAVAVGLLSIAFAGGK